PALTDAVGTNPNSIVNYDRATDLDASDIEVHVSPPVISEIQTKSPYLNGTYGINAKIPVIISFVDAVTDADEKVYFKANASLEVTMNTGAVVTIEGSDLAVDGFSAEGEYTVGAGDTETDELRVTGITKSTATAVYDEFSNNLDLDLDGSSATQGDATDTELPNENFDNGNWDEIAIDVTEPTLNSIDAYIELDNGDKESFTAGTAGIGDKIDLVLSFSEDVKVDGTLTIALNTNNGNAEISAGSSITYPDDASKVKTLHGTYTVAENQETDVLDITSISLPAGKKLTDNPLSLNGSDDTDKPNSLDPISYDDFTPTHNIKIDGVRPTVTQVTTTEYKYATDDNGVAAVFADAATLTQDGTYGIGSRIKFQISFSEAVELSGGNIDLDLGLNQGSLSIEPTDIIGNADPALDNRTAEAILTVI
ncbi:uncharacterized protein METZ01_LOCUS273861, partial [marine metagenome]